MPTIPFYGEIMPFAGNYAPAGWLPCDGRLVSIAQYDTLFTLIGTIYGGDGVSTFALPDLRGRVTVHNGQGQALSPHSMGELAGSETVGLVGSQVGGHSHAIASAAAGNASVPNGRVPAPSPAGDLSYSGVPGASMAPGIVSTAGSSVPHNNMQPHLTIFFAIAVEGIFPSFN